VPAARPRTAAARLRRAALGLLALLFGATNLVVYHHARGMVVLVDGAPPPPHLSALTDGEKLKLVLLGATLARPQPKRSPADFGLTAQEVQIPPIDGPPLRADLVVADGGVGTLILLHGYLGARDQLLPVAAWAQGQGWSSLLVDQRGSGESGGDRTSIGRLEAYDAAAAVAWARANRPGPVVIYGFSMGAAAAIGAVARAGAQPDGLVLEGCYADLREAVGWRVALMGLPERPLSEWLGVWGSVVLGANLLAQSPEEDARRVHVPTLLLHGADDPRAPADHGRRIEAGLQGPRRLVVLPDTGHQLGVDHAPAPWAAAVAALLEQASAGRGPGAAAVAPP
jgi:alpha-beta hydrolase superfamily lysophospholipase